MKVFRNEVLKGRKGIELTIQNEASGQDKMDYRLILKLVTMNGIPKESLSLENMRKANKILDQLELEEEEKAETISLEDDWFNFVNPHVEKFLVDFYRVHSPHVVDQIATLEIKPEGNKA